LVRVAASAASVSAIPSQRDPLRVRPGAPLASRLVVARARASPRREVPRAGERAHVAAGLGDDDFRGSLLHAGDRAQQLNRLSERAKLVSDRVGEPVDLLIKEVQVREDR
jgi:hypothetical protein